MKSIRIEQFSDDNSNVQICNVDKPEPGPGEVLVKMICAPVNPSDFNFIRGTYNQALSRVIWNLNEQVPFFDPQRQLPCPVPPYALGGEGVGVVEATGSGLLARRLQGKRVAVAAGPPMGSWQEYTVVEARKAMPVPKSMSDEQAAMFFVNPLSAYIMVKEVLQVPAGGWLLQTAAGSALGKSVVRMGRHFGFKTINVVRSGANTAELKQLGADVVVETDSQDLLTEVNRVTDAKGVGSALDCVGGSLAEDVVRCLGLDGHLCVYGTLADAPISLPSRDLMMPVSRVSGFYVPNWLGQQNPLKLLSVLRGVKKLGALGIFETEVSDRFAFSDIQSALAAAVQKGRTGKTILQIS